LPAEHDLLETDLVARARLCCIRAHEGQKRDGGDDYATHPHAVARTLREGGVTDAATLAAAYLHDVLEDTPTSEADLTAEFGAEIAGLVVELTNRVPAALPFERKHAALIEHARRMSPRAKLIKLADRLHNLGEMTIWPAWKRERYARAALELLDALSPLPDANLGEQVRHAALRHLPPRAAEHD
jgi:GTP pyrophosphokinase